ncbi:CBL-interacting serine/threonine-protein kinase 23, partial [Camellia lanceoleosa]
RITIAEVIENEWFKKGYKPPAFENKDVSLDDVDVIFNESGKTGRKGHLSVAIEIYEVAPSLCMVEVIKAGEDTLEFQKSLSSCSLRRCVAMSLIQHHLPIDFYCGANDFIFLMKKKLDETGTRCSYKNYDVLQAKEKCH